MEKLGILVVDDDTANRSLLQKRLAMSDFQVDTAEDGVRALELIEDKHYDVVITDLMMPGGIDGIGVLEAVKKNDIGTEVIIITGYGSIDNVITAMKKGAVDYLQKPINFDELLLRLDKISDLKKLLKNASDLRDAMDVTETVSAQTIQALEMTINDLENRLKELKEILSRNDGNPQELIKLALEKYD